MAGHRGAIATPSTGWRLAWVLCLVLCIVRTSVAQAPQVYGIDLHTANLAEALNGLSEQTGVPVVFSYDLVKDRKANPVVGRYTLLEALNALLKDSGLSGGLSEKGVLTVSPTKPAAPEKRGETSVTHEDQQQNTNKPRTAHVASIATFFAAIASAFTANAQDASDASSNAGPPDLPEVLVTAQKREERLQDVPVPISVLDTQALAETSQVALRDYYTSVPGLDVVPNYVGVQNVIIRGISTGADGTPTVGIVIDDAPFGGSTGQIGNFVPEIDPGDLARIEVLRGPQGTLYGSNSMGGLIKYVTKDPSTDGYSGRIEAGTSSVYNGAEYGYNMRASANIPLSDTFAVRVSGFRRQDPGYINNVLTGQTGVNEAQADGGRLSALWRPSADFSLKLSALYQDITANGLPEVDTLPGLGNLQQERIPNAGASDTTAQAYSAILDYKLGSVELTSVTGFNGMNLKEAQDITPAYGLDVTPYGSSFVQSLTGVAGARLDGIDHGTKFDQELRLAISLGQRFDWLLGGFFTRERSHETDRFIGEDPATGHEQGVLFADTYPLGYNETAAFTDLTYKVTDQFDVQVGGRESFIKSYQYAYTMSGALFGPGVSIFTPEIDTSSNAFTYLVTPRFKVNSDLMFYARFASGYRVGGSNPTNAIEAGAPPNYAPDKTKNYEFGVKGDVLDHLLSVDASFFYIDWPGIQTTLLTPNGQESYTANAGAAKSEGVELSVTANPVTGLTISAWGDYDDAVLTKPFPANSTASAPAGARLPNSAKWSGHASVEQDFPLPRSATGFVGGAVSYVGDRENIFVNTGQQRYTLPAYTKVDLRAGVKVESWTVNFYANNVNNSHGLLEDHVGNNLFPNTVIPIQPRTVGVSVTKAF